MSILHFIAGAAAGYWYGSRVAAAATTTTNGPPAQEPDPEPEYGPLPMEPTITDPTGASTYGPIVDEPKLPKPKGLNVLNPSMSGLMDPWIEPAYFNLARPYARGVELSAYRDPLRRELPRIPRLRRAWLPQR